MTVRVTEKTMYEFVLSVRPGTVRVI
jgi:hypothetical protein